MSTTRQSYSSDVSDTEWEFLIPYLTLMREDAPQRDYARRDVFDAVRYVVKTGCPWDFLPHDFPRGRPWTRRPGGGFPPGYLRGSPTTGG